ncbi:hypothetical protein IWW37_003166 [Coemansia sp. RSA 2050]|nr:hypothetical protein IWW37_003166 [Coemansia sp. RSA 2050]
MYSSTNFAAPPGSSILFYLNGQRIVVDHPDLDMTLLQYLRSTGLTGTKLGCGEGGCGACTVMVSRYDTDESRVIHASVNACLCPLVTIDGKHVITVEGLRMSAKPHPIQERIALLHGSQCGFCTPGFVMSLYTLLRNKPNPTEHEIEECFDGNLCRCTGYRPILDAAKTFADMAWKQGTAAADGSIYVSESKAKGGCGIDGCCRLQKSSEAVVTSFGSAIVHDPTKSPTSIANGGCCNGSGSDSGSCCKARKQHDSPQAGCKAVNQAEADKAAVISRFQRYDPTQELIFPPFLIRYAKRTTNDSEPQLRPLDITSTDAHSWCQRYIRPLTLSELLAALEQHPDAKLVAGNSRLGMQVKLKRSKFPMQIYVNDIPELRQISETSSGVTFGANITLAKFERALDSFVAKYGAQQTQSLAALRENLRHIANSQIRNVATIAGNIVTASPISDLNPVFLAAGAILTLASTGGERRVPISEFILGYQRTAMLPGEVLVSVSVLFNKEGEVVRAFKQAKRKVNDIAIVTCGFRVRVDENRRVVDAAFAYGGVASTTVLAHAAASAAIGSTWGDRAALDCVLGACQQELQLDYAAQGGMAEYRMALTTSFLFKFWGISCNVLRITCTESMFAHELSEERVVSKARQEYAPVEDRVIVGKGVAHLAALKQVTGEARYVDDMPELAGELHVGLVLSTRVHARILGINAEKALSLPGVVRVLTARDVPGENHWNIFKDEEILPADTVFYYGQPLALILAATQRIAQEAARLVSVTYKDLPAVLSIRDAIAQSSFYDETCQLINGDVDTALTAADLVLEGESYCGAQEHFYLETMVAIAVPKGEDGELEVFASTQNPTEAQMVIAQVLGVPASRVVCRVKRIGGGFGGKDARSIPIAAFAALGAHNTGRSVRIALGRDEDMQTSGQRHPFLGKWTVGVTKEGRILGMRMQIYNNGGFSHDMSVGVLEHATAHLDNCYRMSATDFLGRVCRTNTQSKTAFRGFGACQGMFLTESMLCEVADRLGLSVEAVREINLYQHGDATPFNQKLVGWNVPRMWTQLKAKAKYDERRQAVDEFNSQSIHRKRGLAMLPTKFGISFEVKHLNQGMALVHVYMDGSVLVAHGGTEMGQGLHTKMAMVAAETLELPLESIFISETATNTAANTSPTAASVSSDLNGYAVYNACKELADRLRPYRQRMAGESFAAIAKAAYLDCCNLTATGHYCTPDIGYDWAKNEGLLYFYFTQGVAIAEVELDTLTGTHSTLRVDIIMDIGRSLNKALDIGQIEGAFAQGQGWTTMEEFLHSSSTGQTFTTGPSSYKIPSAMDIPRDFRVELLEGADTSALKTIFSSKGVGEPPLFLGASVFFALRDAVLAKRRQLGVTAPLHMESPATPETLRMACEDRLALMARIPQDLREGKAPFVIRI